MYLFKKKYNIVDRVKREIKKNITRVNLKGKKKSPQKIKYQIKKRINGGTNNIKNDEY